MNPHLTKKQDGFTLVETLVAIAVLMIAIAGPLVIASQALNAAVYAKDQMTASYLAQEGMELLKNLKDDGIAQGNTIWYEGAATNCFSAANSTNDRCGITVSTLLTPPIEICTLTTALYLDSNGYNCIGSGNLTPFSRSFSLYQVGKNEIMAVVTVSWYQGSIQDQVQISDEFFNATE